MRQVGQDKRNGQGTWEWERRGQGRAAEQAGQVEAWQISGANNLDSTLPLDTVRIRWGARYPAQTIHKLRSLHVTDTGELRGCVKTGEFSDFFLNRGCVRL